MERYYELKINYIKQKKISRGSPSTPMECSHCSLQFEAPIITNIHGWISNIQGLNLNFLTQVGNGWTKNGEIKRRKEK